MRLTSRSAVVVQSSFVALALLGFRADIAHAQLDTKGLDECTQKLLDEQARAKTRRDAKQAEEIEARAKKRFRQCSSNVQVRSRYLEIRSKIESYASLSSAAYDMKGTPPAGGEHREVKYRANLGRPLVGSYLLITDDRRKTHQIIVRGTVSRDDAWIDAQTQTVRDPHLKIEVHKGFQSLAAAIYEDAPLKEGYSVGLGGHSLGGAAAQIVGWYLKARKNKAIDEIYTFGQPRFTNKWGARANPLNKISVRVVACDDPIPLVPGTYYNANGEPEYYDHAGTLVMLMDNGYVWISDTEIFRNSFTRTISNLTAPEKSQIFYWHRITTYLDRLKRANASLGVLPFSQGAKQHCRGTANLQALQQPV